MNPVIRSVAHEARRYEPWPQPKARRLPSTLTCRIAGMTCPGYEFCSHVCVRLTTGQWDEPFRVPISERIAARGGRR